MQCALLGCDVVSEQFRLATEEFLLCLRRHCLNLSSSGITPIWHTGLFACLDVFRVIFQL